MKDEELYRIFEDSPFVFSPRPSAIPADQRPDWRVILILLTLYKCCRSNKSSFKRLHVLNWATRNEEARQNFFMLLDGKINPGDIIVRHEPGLNRAIDLALGERLLRIIKGNRVELTEHGLSVVQEIEKSHDCLKLEREFLDVVSRRLTEQKVQELVEMVTS
jgi:hypothetical protein